MGRDFSQLVVPEKSSTCRITSPLKRLIRGSGPEQMFVRNNLLFVTMLHSDKVEVFKINQAPTDVPKCSPRRVSILPEGSRRRSGSFT
jgi:hypothetical protein